MHSTPSHIHWKGHDIVVTNPYPEDHSIQKLLDDVSFGVEDFDIHCKTLPKQVKETLLMNLEHFVDSQVLSAHQTKKQPTNQQMLTLFSAAAVVIERADYSVGYIRAN